MRQNNSKACEFAVSPTQEEREGHMGEHSYIEDNDASVSILFFYSKEAADDVEIEPGLKRMLREYLKVSYEFHKYETLENFALVAEYQAFKTPMTILLYTEYQQTIIGNAVPRLVIVTEKQQVRFLGGVDDDPEFIQVLEKINQSVLG